jgi:hypothetical protein
MRIRALLLVVLVAIDAALLLGLRRLDARRAELERRNEESRALFESSRRADQYRVEVSELLKSAMAVMPETPFDLALLRDSLIAAERGLDVDRISLDFRPSTGQPAGFAGGAVSANLQGSFRALGEYLGRVEALPLPLAAEELSLRSGDGGRALLTIRWRALWGMERTFDPMALEPGEVMRLRAWLARGEVPAHALPARHLFRRGDEVEAFARTAPPEPPPPPDEGTAEPERGTPVLSGFVLARPELEADVSRRILAALRFEGELRLLKVGDLVGRFRVERIDAPESVLLVDERTGESLRLFLE